MRTKPDMHARFWTRRSRSHCSRNGRTGPRKVRRRRLNLERLEPRTLLAGDASPLVSFQLAALDLDTLEPLEAVHQGSPFLLAMYAQDLRADGSGVYGAYADVEYPADALELVPLPLGEMLFHSPEFTNGLSGDASVPGVADELGGFVADTTPPGTAKQLVAGVPLVPTRTGNISFSINPADSMPFHQVLLFDEELAISELRQQFAGLTLDVQPALPDTGIDAVADAFSVDAGSENNRFDVLGNDRNDNGGALLISAVDTRRLRGTVRIVERGRSLFYTPPAGFAGEERFTYTAEAGGKQDITSVIVRVERDEPRLETAAFYVELTDAAGEPLPAVHVGDEFLLHVYSEDLRAQPQGVFGAYVDVEYPASNVEVAGDLKFGALYQNGRTGKTSSAGVIDEAGGIAQLDPLGGGRLLVFSVPVRATHAGSVVFTASPADLLPVHQVLVFGQDEALPLAEVFYGHASLEVLPTVIAVDDAFRVQAGPAETVLPVLANDLNLGTAALQVTAINAAGLFGQIRIVNGGGAISYTPPLGFSGSEQFTYTATSSSGSHSAEVTVHVAPAAGLDDVVALRLQTTNLAGDVITSVEPGQPFLVQVLAKDLRAAGIDRGVYAAFLDLLYDREVVHVMRSTANPTELGVDFGPEYQNGISARSLVPGILDEVGAFQTSSNALGSGEQLLFSAQFRARNEAGQADAYSLAEDSETVLDVIANDTQNTEATVADFRSDPSDDAPHSDVLLFEPPTAVPFPNISFGTATLNVLGDGNPVIASVGRPNHGGHVEIGPDGRHLIYRPAPNFSGVETFFYTLDGETRIEVNIAVAPVNDAPVANADFYRLDVNGILQMDELHGVLANDRDAEGSVLSTTLMAGPQHGDLTLLRDGSFEYTPVVGFSGVDRFTYQVSDGDLVSDLATAEITVVAQPVSIRLQTLDSSGQPLLDATTDQPLWLQALVQDRRVGVARPGLGAVYVDVEFDPTLVQPQTASGAGAINLQFGAGYQNANRGDALVSGRLNDAGGMQTSVQDPPGPDEVELFRAAFEQHGPRAFDDLFAVPQDSETSVLRVLKNETERRWFVGFIAAPAHNTPHADVVYFDPAEAVPTADINFSHTAVAVRNGVLRIQSVTPSVHGAVISIEEANGTISYTPAPGFVGEDTFSYTILDSLGRAATAKVTVEVTATWQNPVESLDSNADGDVSPVDVLLVINDLNAFGSRPVSSVPATTAFLDVSGDGFVSPLDVLLIINRLVLQVAAEGEGRGLESPIADVFRSPSRAPAATAGLAASQSPIRFASELDPVESASPDAVSQPLQTKTLEARRTKTATAEQLDLLLDLLALDLTRR